MSKIKKEYVNAVLIGIKNTLETVTKEKVILVKPTKISNPIAMGYITTMVGLTRELRGHIYFTYTKENAKVFASKMMMGMPVDKLDDMSKSVISELHNMSMGGVCTKLEQVGKIVDITPPTMIEGNDIRVSGKEKKNLNLFFDVAGTKVGVTINVKEAN